MKSIKIIAILLFSTTVFSQSISNKNSETSFIEVTGKAEKEIVPDEIYIDICIKERIQKGKKLTIEFLENSLKTELRNIGIPEGNLSISDVNAVLSKTGWWKEEVLSVANYTLKVNGAEKLKKLFKTFDKQKISEVNIIKATHSKIISLRRENRIAAIKAAKEKANYLLSAIGERTGKPIKINEITNSDQQDYALANTLNQSSSYKGLSKFRTNKNEVVQFEKIKISSSFYIKYEIK